MQYSDTNVMEIHFCLLNNMIRYKVKEQRRIIPVLFPHSKCKISNFFYTSFFSTQNSMIPCDPVVEMQKGNVKLNKICECKN